MGLSWQHIHADALRRIQSREWQPGALIPNEEALAKELGCARATVNRALRALAEEGWLERRRKAGTRVALSPKRRAQMAIPVIRQEIEALGQQFSHQLIERVTAPMPDRQCDALGLPAGTIGHHVRSLYLADDRPFAYEDRWVNLIAAPGFDSCPLDKISPNEWLVQNAPFANGTLEYWAAAASGEQAMHLDCALGTSVMVLERHTFGPDAPVTAMSLTYAPGHRLQLRI
ncbi:MAG: UTRA domain-containing protein [Rhodobacteraceae bacterium]|nr:UTRA domain-containing protein [Paracoccaceae bacterium]